MGRIRNTLVTAAIGAALAAQSAPAQTAPAQPTTTTSGTTRGAPTSTSITPSTGIAGPVSSGDPLTAPVIKPPKTPAPKTNNSGGTPAKEPSKQPATAPTSGGNTPVAPTTPNSLLSVPSFSPSVSGCGTPGAPAALMPIYQAASDRYGLGPQGPGILAAINQIETNFGELNQVTSSAGAIGWMQFMPATWATYGVDANGDGTADPYDPQDAIFAAARYLRAGGMPGDPYSAVYAYNHADWYVSEVLSNAVCLGASSGGGGISLTPSMPVLSCQPAPAWKHRIPADYIDAFDSAAGRYDLGRRGVWAMAAIARLESNFGKGMSKKQLRATGPLGLDPTEWKRYAVDGNGDGVVRHASIGDSAATLARLIWSRGDLEAGVFAHNQAEWYVQAVLSEADQLQGNCTVTTISWTVSLPDVYAGYVNPFVLSSGVIDGRIDQGMDFTGTGPIVAIGNARVLQVGAPGWPEGGGVAYQLLDGPLAGDVIYVYEGISATVRAGETVATGQEIGVFVPGGSIEVGFADTSGVPLSHALYHEGDATASGGQMSVFLRSLGV